MIKKIIILIVLCFLTLSSVNAVEDNVTDTVSLDECDDEALQAEDDAEILQDNDGEILQESSEIKVSASNDDSHYGYWVLSKDMNSLDLDDLSNHGVSDILLNFKAYENNDKSKLESWISNANSKGIHVHIWTQVFWTQATKWVKPVVNGKPNNEFFQTKINEIKNYAEIKGVSGIHFDYLRFSGSSANNNAAWQNTGGADAISQFVKDAVSAIHEINPNIIISAALMPEPSSLEKVYGDQYSVLSKYLDVIIPMVYRGNYNQNANWIKTTTKWFVDNSKHANVWTGLQSYNNDEDTTSLSFSRMNTDINAALSGGASGVILFRYGVSKNIDFTIVKNTNAVMDAKSASVSILYGDTYSVTVKDSKNNLLSGEEVIFTLDGKKIASTITNSKGVASVKIPKKLSLGNHKLIITLSSEYYDKITKTVNIKVVKEKLNIKTSKSSFKVIVKNQNYHKNFSIHFS